MYVGCGKCGACLSNRRADWSFRIKEEAKASTRCDFVTLTYHDSTLPMTNNLGMPTLCKRDIQLFNKSLRNEQEKYTNIKYRFFCVGEYGTKFHRPHYHIIFFNLHSELAKPENLLPIWFNGIVTSVPLDQGLTHYTTKYHVTAQKHTRNLNIHDDRIDEFTLSSNKPPVYETEKFGGIGYQYIKNCKAYHLKTRNAFIVNNGYKQRMPNYYYRHIFKDLPEAEKEIMRQEAQTLVEQTEEKELRRLSKKGYKNPRYEYLRRLSYAAKDVKFKANKKGIF